MKTSTSNFLLAAGAVAQLASAQPRLHRRDEITITDTDVVYTTITEYVTIGGAAPSAYSASSGNNNVGSSHSHGHHHHYSSAQSTSGAAASSSAAQGSAPAYSVSASPFTTFSIPADSSSASAAAPLSSSVGAASLSGYGSSSAPASASGYSSSSSAAPVSSSASSDSSSAAPASTSAYSSSSAAAGPSGYSSSSAPASGSPSGYSTTAQSSASSSTSSAPASSGTSATGVSGYSGIKAGLSGYVGCQSQPGFDSLAPYIGWYSDYSANTTDATTSTTPNVNGGKIQGIPMLWGDGISCASVSSGRLQGFEDNVNSASDIPIMFGLYEPDCDCDMSSGISDVGQGVSDWNKYLAPLKSKFGTTLGSPSMCKQKDETWLTEFAADSSKPSWDITSIHINVNNIDDLKADIEYYVGKFGKPVWVTEFACVQGVPWTPCTDQDQINTFIEQAVSYFEGNDSVVAYGASNGEGLGDVWPLFTSDTHELSPTGQKYFDVLSALKY